MTKAKPKIEIRGGIYPRVRLRTKVGTKSRTKQSFTDECNVNNIMSKYEQTGLVTHVHNQQPRFGIESKSNFHEVLNAKAAIATAFEELDPEDQDLYGSPEGLFAALQEPAAEEKPSAGASDDNPPKEPEKAPEEGSSDASDQDEPDA